MAKSKHRKPSATKQNIKRVTVATGTAAIAVGTVASPAVASPTYELAPVTNSINTVGVFNQMPVLTAPVVAPEAALVTGQSVVNEARKYLGANYVWGGESFAEGGFDCSGLVFRVFTDLGISVPRTSGALASAGIAVSEAQAGDILTYPGHVAIAVGNGRMIDAATPGTVVQERAIWGNPSVRRLVPPGSVLPAPAPAPVVIPEPAPPAPEPVAPAPVAESPPAAPVEGEQVTVVDGDTLSDIAVVRAADWHKVYEDNRAVIGDNPDKIYPGQVFFVGGLRLPSAPVTVEEEVVETPAGEEVVVPEITDGSAIITNSAGPVAQSVQAAANRVFNEVRGASLITIGGTRGSAIDPNGHPSGKALDYMVMSDAGLGDSIVSFHVANWDALGVEYIIWEQRILTSPGGSWELMADRGSATQNHRDHVHVNYR